MRYQVLATDYDGTIAFDGQVDEPTIAALGRAKAEGLRLVLVTGRELTDLFNTFEHSDIFERIVAENGAVLYDPATKSVEPISPPPPPALVETLERQSVPISVGHSIVATVEPYEHQVLAAIRDLGLEWHVIFNKGSVMALPSDVTKATGLVPTLGVLGVSTSPQPWASPSRIENRIPSSSSPGLFGWMRDPKWWGAPIAAPSPSSGLKSTRATNDSSSLVITLTTAAIASLTSAS